MYNALKNVITDNYKIFLNLIYINKSKDMSFYFET